MKIIIDTHALLWFFSNDNNLSKKARRMIRLKKLPFIHKDPFDRLIACQSIVEEYTLVSIDKIFDEYNIKRIW